VDLERQRVGNFLIVEVCLSLRGYVGSMERVEIEVRAFVCLWYYCSSQSWGRDGRDAVYMSVGCLHGVESSL
jgi:hypothetical protein